MSHYPIPMRPNCHQGIYPVGNHTWHRRWAQPTHRESRLIRLGGSQTVRRLDHQGGVTVMRDESSPLGPRSQPIAARAAGG